MSNIINTQIHNCLQKIYIIKSVKQIYFRSNIAIKIYNTNYSSSTHNKIRKIINIYLKNTFLQNFDFCNYFPKYADLILVICRSTVSIY